MFAGVLQLQLCFLELPISFLFVIVLLLFGSMSSSIYAINSMI